MDVPGIKPSRSMSLSATSSSPSGSPTVSQTNSPSTKKAAPPIPQKPKWTYQQLDLDEVVEDSPMIRDKIRLVEEDVDQLSIRLKRTSKVMRQIRNASTDLSLLFKQFAEELSELGETMNDEVIKSGYAKLASSFNEAESFRELLGSQMENVMCAPMDAFVHDVDEAKEKKKRVDRASLQYEAVLGRTSQLKRTDVTKTAEAEHELVTAKKEFLLSSLDYVSSLNSIQARKKFDFLEKSTAFTYANLAYFHQGYELYNEIGGNYMRQLSAYLQKCRQTYDVEQQRVTGFFKDVENKISAQFSGQATPVKTTATTMQGYLFKRSSNMRKDWKRRYFVIEDGMVSYYRHGKDPTPITAINLLLCTVKVKHDIDRRFCFEIISPDKTYTLQADDQERMMMWIAVIQNGISDLLNQQHIGDKSPHSHRAKKEAQLEIWNAIRSVNTHNTFCVDCGTPDPDWASINLGIIVCIDCSGIHRSMGVHISKVRSFTLDKWEPEIIKIMVTVGNENFNRIYECNVPSGIKKPDPSSDRATREKYLKMKYIDKQFVLPSPVSQDSLNNRLYSAAEDNKPLGVLLYLAQGANPNFVNEEDGKKTPLHIAVFEGNYTCVTLLIHNRADVNAVDAKLWTPLHYAACFGKTSCGCVLFKNGAKLEPKNDDEHTPLDLAVATQKADVVTFLRLALLATKEGSLNDESFTEALQTFSIDTATDADDAQQS